MWDTDLSVILRDDDTKWPAGFPLRSFEFAPDKVRAGTFSEACG